MKSKYFFIFFLFIFTNFIFKKIIIFYFILFYFSSFGIKFILQIRNSLKLQNIPIGTILKYHFFGLSSQGIPRHPIIDQIINSTTNNSLSSSSTTITNLQDIILYRIEFSGTHHPQCRICRNISSSKQQIVIRTSGIYFPPSISNSAGFANWIFCFNYSCIQNLIESKEEKLKMDIQDQNIYFQF